MVGTDSELLYFFLEDWRAVKKLGIPQKKVKTVRYLIKTDKLGHDTIEKYLTTLGCMKLRDRIVLPSILSKNGRFYTEVSVLSRLKQEDYPEFDIVKLYSSCHANGHLPNKSYVNKIRRRGRYKLETERITLPAVWEYAPWKNEPDRGEYMYSLMGVD